MKGPHGVVWYEDGTWMVDGHDHEEFAAEQQERLDERGIPNFYVHKDDLQVGGNA